MNELEQKLVYMLYECNKHKKMIDDAYFKLKKYLPLSIASYNAFNTDNIGHIDQFLFRFSKLQDTMGDRLFTTILLLLNEDWRNKPFIDIINRLEKLELLDKNSWIKLRKIRNDVAHEYHDNTEELVNSLNNIFTTKKILLSSYDTFFQFCTNKFNFVKTSRFLS